MEISNVLVCTHDALSLFLFKRFRHTQKDTQHVTQSAAPTARHATLGSSAPFPPLFPPPRVDEASPGGVWGAVATACCRRHTRRCYHPVGPDVLLLRMAPHPGHRGRRSVKGPRWQRACPCSRAHSSQQPHAMSRHARTFFDFFSLLSFLCFLEKLQIQKQNILKQ